MRPSSDSFSLRLDSRNELKKVEGARAHVSVLHTAQSAPAQCTANLLTLVYQLDQDIEAFCLYTLVMVLCILYRFNKLFEGSFIQIQFTSKFILIKFVKFPISLDY